AGVMVKPAELGSLIQGHDRIFTQRAVAHCRDIEYTAGVRLLTMGATHRDTGVLIDFKIIDGRYTMAQPFIIVIINVELGSERRGIQHLLGTLVDHAPEYPAERPAGGVTFHKILLYFRTDT